MRPAELALDRVADDMEEALLQRCGGGAFRGQRAAAGAAFIVSSHLLSLIEDLCTHLLVLHRGQALFSGTVDDARALASQSATAATLEESFFHIVRDAVES